MATLVTMSNPRLPGSVVGETSIGPKRFFNKVTSVQVVQDGKDMYSKSSANLPQPVSPSFAAPSDGTAAVLVIPGTWAFTAMKKRFAVERSASSSLCSEQQKPAAVAGF
jgi:hypothetical protein